VNRTIRQWNLLPVEILRTLPVNQMLLERGLEEWLMWWTEGTVRFGLNYLKRAVEWSEVQWSEVKWCEVKGGKSGRTLKGVYGWWSEVKWSEGPVKICVMYQWNNNITKEVQYFLPIMLPFLCAFLLTAVGLLSVVLLSCVYFCYHMRVVLLYVYCCLTYFTYRIAC